MLKAKRDKYVVKYLFMGFIFMLTIMFCQLVYNNFIDYAVMTYHTYKFNKARAIRIKAGESEIDLYKRATDRDIPQAMYALGHMYYIGDQVTKDYLKAIELYKRASEKGERLAQYNLGHMYKTGEGVEVDLEKAIYYYDLSAAQGYNLALRALAGIYSEGIGIEKDLIKSQELEQQASKSLGISVSYEQQIRQIIKYQLGEF